MAKSNFILFLHKTDSLGAKGLSLMLTGCTVMMVNAQMSRLPVAAGGSSIQAYRSQPADGLSWLGNQAALSEVTHFSAGVYSERRFFLNELAQYNFALCLPASAGNFGVATAYMGGSSYHESQLALAYGRKLGTLQLGAQFNFYSIKAASYRPSSSINFEVGALLRVNEHLKTGFHIYNPVASRIGNNDDERLPVICSFGLGYQASDQLYIGSQLEKVEDRSVVLHTGVQYHFQKQLFVRAGISTMSSSYYFGAGFLINQFSIEVLGSLHQQLGLSPGLILIYNAPCSK